MEPTELEKPRLVALTAWSMEASWTVPSFDGNTPVTSFIVRLAGRHLSAVVSVPSTTFVTIFTDLSAYTIYSVQVRAVNKVGAGSFSEVTSAQTKQAST